jgi:hypothetical protein
LSGGECRGVLVRETVVSNERLELTGPRGQPPRDVAPDEGRFHDKGALFIDTNWVTYFRKNETYLTTALKE